METIWKVLTRKKILDPVSAEQTELGRVLNTFDLTALGVGSTLGVGVYVLAGQVAKETAGPSVVGSFLIATIASVFAGLCYAEFGARAPRAGSAYIYSYVCVGEFVAFVIGWNLILEYVIGSASVARGLSLYLDTLINGTLQDTFKEIAPINVSFMSEYFDFFAFGVSIILAVALAFGMRESSIVNNIVTMINLSVVLFVVIAGATKADTKNWDLPAQNGSNGTKIDNGGFFPFGVEGMIKGAATCFYGFVGFDCIATTGEEVKNPKRAIPFSIILSLFIIFLAYFGTSTVITLMLPYYEQDPDAPIPHVFEKFGWDVAKWLVTIGAIFGLCSSLFGAMFPLPRIIYAMASDSLIFRFLGKVSVRFRTPVTGTILAGLLTGLMAAMFKLNQLVNMMSIGTLLAYTIVAASVLLLRYETEKGFVYEPLRALLDSEDNDTYTDNRGVGDVGTSEESELISNEHPPKLWRQIFHCGRQDGPTELSEKIVKVEVCIYCIMCLLMGLCAMYLNKPISDGEIWAIVLSGVVVCVTVLVIMSIATQPTSRKELSFKVPLVPLIPALSILINIYLMLMLDANTWIRFAVWMLLGIPTYYFSIPKQIDARNDSISSKVVANGKANGFTNHGFVGDDPNSVYTEHQEIPKKKKAPPPPSLRAVESTIAVLDEILQKEESSSLNNRKTSVDSISIASNVLRNENVEADVHCADVPPTPVQIIQDPLLQFSDVNASPVVVMSEITESDPGPLKENGSSNPSPVAGIDKDPASNSYSPSTLKEDECSSNVTVENSINNTNSDQIPALNNDGLVSPSDFVPPDNNTPSTPDNSPSSSMTIQLEENNDNGKEIKPELVIEDNQIVPPPPPMLLELSEVNIPRPKFRISEINSVKLKPTKYNRMPEMPPIDYSRQNSEVALKERVIPPDDNVKFGTPEHKEFLDHLNQTLQVVYTNTKPLIDPPKKINLEGSHSSSNFTNEKALENEEEETTNKNDIREKLTEFLTKRPNILPITNHDEEISTDENKPNSIRNEPTLINANDEKRYKEEHKKNMSDIFGSIKLRKVDSFKADVTSNGVFEPNEGVSEKKEGEKIKQLNDKDGDQALHRINMNDTLNSIRLRKIESFKVQE